MRWLIVFSLCLLSALPGSLAAVETLPTDTPLLRVDLPVGITHDSLAQPDFPVLATAVSPDGQQLATAGYQMLYVWDRKTGRLLHAWKASDSWIRVVTFSPNGYLLATAGDAGDLKLWDWEQSLLVHHLSNQGDTLYTIAFNPHGDLLASGGVDKTIRIWDVANGQLLKKWFAHTATIRAMVFNPDGNLLISGAQDGVLSRWHWTEGLPVAHPFKNVELGIYSLAFSPDGRWIAAGTFRAIHLWDAITGQARPLLKKHTSWVRSLAFNADSTQLLSAADDALLYLWQLSNDTILERWAGHQAAVFSVSFMQNREWLSASGDGRILVWQQGTPTPVWRLIGYPDGRWLSCHMVNQPHCEQADNHTQTPTPDTLTDPHLKPPLIGFSWQHMAWLFCVIVTFLAVVGKQKVRPMIRAWVAILHALQQKWRAKQLSLSLPSPARFARRLGGVLDFSAPNNRHMARICLAADFPLAISDFFYIRLQRGQTLDKIPILSEYFVRSFIGQADENGVTTSAGGRPPLVVLVGADAEQMGVLHQFAHHLDRLWVVPDLGEMTRLLLAAQPGQAFAHLLADHLDPALLSPYQTDVPIEKAGLFFGRQPLLEQLTQQGRRNHLLIGGQGMGKSSLLRTLMRKYMHHPIIQCHLFMPEQADIALPLAHLLGYTNSTDLGELLDELARFPDRKKPILLIDDADAFVVTDAKRNWTVLKRLQQLSDAGCCHTILAASWDLQRMLHSSQTTRLTEWVDLHYLGPLEPEASWQLVRGPMAWINRTWDSGVCLDLIQASGGRPDWTMTLCHAVLEQLGPQDKTINQHHLDAAKISRTVGERFDRWPALLSANVEENRQDRLVVYSSVAIEPFTHGELLSLLQKKYAAFFALKMSQSGGCPPGEQLQQALDRLEMASLLQKAGDRYFYPSKLLRTRIMQQHPADRLKKALQDHSL